MHKTKFLLCLSTALITLSVFIFTASCHKNDSNNSTPEDTGYASDNNKMEQNSNDVIAIADKASISATGTNFRTTSGGGCAPVITNDTTVSPHVLTIDFGSTDCTDSAGRTHRGMIIVTYTGHYKDALSTHTITYNNYYVNDNKLSGNKTVYNNGLNGSGQIYYTVTVNDSLTTTVGIITWRGIRIRTWLTGYTTATRIDDSYSISGTDTLVRADGNQYTMSVAAATPLQIAFDCPYIESGIVNIVGPAGIIRKVDFGSGTCDAHATLTIGTHTYEITL